MSLNTQIVIPAHVGVEEVCGLLRADGGASNVRARPMRRAEHWVIEYVDADGVTGSLDAFLQSYAADDYPELGGGPSTLLSLPYGPPAIAMAKAVATASSGWFRMHEGAEWQQAAPASHGQPAEPVRH